MHCNKDKDSGGLNILHLGRVCRKGHCMQSNWKTLTLPRTGGQTTFLLRSERPFSHYAAALIYRNTKIQLNGAIFSFAFGGHFSCLENSSHSDGTRGSIVIIACSVRVRRPGLHSLADTRGPQLELTLHHTPSCVAMDRQQRQGRGGYCPIVGSIKEGRIHQWLLSALGRIFFLANPVRNIGHIVEPTRPANIV